MEAFGIEGIPHAFVVDKAGRIAWHGHPMMGLDQTLEQVVAGTFDPATARKRSDAQSKLEAFFALASEGGDEAKLDAMAGELEALDKELGGIMPNGKRFDAAELKKGVRVQGLVREYALALKKGDEARTAELEKQIEGNAPKDFDFPKFKEAIQVQVLWEQYYRAVSSGAADADKVAALAKKLGAMKITNAQVLNELAWTLLTDEEIKDRDLALALKLAQAAYDASKGKEGHIVDTYARALFDNGKVAEAVAQQKKAIDLCKDEPDLVKDLTATLQKYEAKAAAK
jgi:hypothetical protein